MDCESYFQEGLSLYNKGYYLKNREDVLSIVSALKYFIQANKLVKNEYLKPKILCFIALCNYKIGNPVFAYRIGYKAKRSIQIVIQNGVIGGITGDMIGEQRIDELIQTIKQNFKQKIKNCDVTNFDFDENNLDLSNINNFLEDTFIPTKSDLKELIQILGDAQKEYTAFWDTLNDPIKGYQLCQMIEIFKSPLLYIWQKYGYGWHSDFWEEGDSMLIYEQFEINMLCNPKEMLNNMINEWKTKLPFQFFGEAGEIVSDKILNIYESLKNNV